MKTFLVVGMHRSATSLIAKGLHLAGVHMGDQLMGATREQPHGHYEDIPAVQLNEQILQAAGGAWNRPPSHEAICDVDSSRVARYVESRGDGPWGVKDPRLALCWPAWLPHLSGDLHIVNVHRDKKQVARSLQRRDGTTLEFGVRLADIYEQRIALLMETVR